MSDKQQNGGGSWLGLSLLGLVGGWIGYSVLAVDHHQVMMPAIGSDQVRFAGSGTGFLSAYVDTSGTGRPLVMIHSINAAGNAYEMRPLFHHYRGQRPVYALDLPGFGFSERANRVYTPQLYTQAIIDLLEKQVGQPADVIALSLGSEFAARAALQRPELFHSLTMISPSGFSASEQKQGSQKAQQRGISDSVHRVFAFPVWSQAFYDLLATRVSIRYFLQQSFEGDVDQGLADYAYITSHQPGARHAPLYFVSGKLFTDSIREDVYEKLTLPVLVLYDRDNFVRFDTLPDVVAKYPNWHAVRIAPTKGLPHFEKLNDVTTALDQFWGEND